MKKLSFFKNGAFVESITTTSDVNYGESRPDCVVIDGEYDHTYFYDQFNRVMKVPERPSIFHTFKPLDGAWIDERSLEELKVGKWEEIKAKRESVSNGGFRWDGSHFDSDEVSQQRITGAVSLAQIGGESFSISWTLANNSTRTLNAQQMIAVGVAAGQHVSAQFTKAQALRVKIEQAITKEELSAIAWL